jgi:predicted transcriptional regulator
VKYLFYINLALGFFNLIPGLPLDGGGVLRAILWGVTHNFRKATIIAANSGRIIAFLMILFGLFLMFRGYFLNGLWIAFIGWFLESAAMAQVQQLRVESLLAGHRVSEVMNRDYSTVAADAPLQQIVDHHILKEGQRALIVKRGDDIIGLLTLHRIKDVQRQDWPVTTAAQAVIPVDQIKLLRADTGLWKALQEMDRDGVNQLPVMEGDKILGMLSREDIISFLRSLDELGQ